jgi:hypothetical protein
MVDTPWMDEEPLSEARDRLQETLEPLADLTRQMTEAARSWTGGGPGRSLSSELLTGFAELVTALPRLWVEPLRRIVEEQRQLAEAMAAWAEQHRELAGQLAESAEHLRQLAEQGAALVDPILTYGARISDVADSWVDLLRVRPEAVPGDGLGDNE